jgi:hypothetical protein
MSVLFHSDPVKYTTCLSKLHFKIIIPLATCSVHLSVRMMLANQYFEFFDFIKHISPILPVRFSFSRSKIITVGTILYVVNIIALHSPWMRYSLRLFIVLWTKYFSDVSKSQILQKIILHWNRQGFILFKTNVLKRLQIDQKQSLCRPEQALRVPGVRSSQKF